jgi:thioredoxin reductase (NADPH)
MQKQVTKKRYRQKRCLFISAPGPGTEWLDSLVLKNENGFILSGSDLAREKSFHTFWKLDRDPFLPETSVPGIFASGDVRFGAMTGISSAVGEGAMAIRFVRKYLQEM